MVTLAELDRKRAEWDRRARLWNDGPAPRRKPRFLRRMLGSMPSLSLRREAVRPLDREAAAGHDDAIERVALPLRLGEAPPR